MWYAPLPAPRSRLRGQLLVNHLGPNAHPAIQPKEDLLLHGAAHVGRGAQKPMPGSYLPYNDRGRWLWPMLREWGETTAHDLWQDTPMVLTALRSPRTGTLGGTFVEAPGAL